MPMTLLDQIEQAEQEADVIRANAQKEAREIIKSVEEANSAMERQMTSDIYEQSSKKVESARTATQDEIKALELRREAQREALKRQAQSRVSQAAMAVFERVVHHGDH